MPVNPAYTTIVKAGVPCYRITTIGHRTGSTLHHKKVVSGQGALANPLGGRYNFPGAVSVYLTETIDTCLAEKMFYFHREVLRSLDVLHFGINPLPSFVQQFVLWEVCFKKDVNDVCDLSIPNAPAYFNVFPSLMRNPSQDYHHLKQRRADIQAQGYNGIRSPSSRCTNNGNMVVLFGDQSKSVQSITPFAAEFRLVDIGSAAFVNHATQLLDFTLGQVQIARVAAYKNFATVPFNH